MENRNAIYSEIENFVDNNYRASDIEYVSELNEAVEELQYLADGGNDILFNEVIEHVEDQVEFDYDSLSDEDAAEFDAMVNEIALTHIDYLTEKCDDAYDDVHSDDYNEDNDWD